MEMERRSSSRRGVTVAARPPPVAHPQQAQAQAQAQLQQQHEPRDSVSHSADGRSVDSVQWSSEAPPSHDNHHRARSDGHAPGVHVAHAHAHSRDAVHPASSLASQTRSMRAFPSSGAHANHARPAHQHVKCKTDFSEPADSLSMDPNYGGVDQHVFRAQLLMVSTSSTGTSVHCTRNRLISATIVQPGAGVGSDGDCSAAMRSTLIGFLCRCLLVCVCVFRLNLRSVRRRAPRPS